MASTRTVSLKTMRTTVKTERMSSSTKQTTSTTYHAPYSLTLSLESSTVSRHQSTEIFTTPKTTFRPKMELATIGGVDSTVLKSAKRSWWTWLTEKQMGPTHLRGLCLRIPSPGALALASGPFCLNAWMTDFQRRSYRPIPSSLIKIKQVTLSFSHITRCWLWKDCRWMRIARLSLITHRWIESLKIDLVSRMLPFSKQTL